jgi:photosystem I P700 chlorophyll a apoprotein A1
MYRTNWNGHSMKESKGPFTGEGHLGLYEILTTSHAQLANLALLGHYLSLLPAICSMPPYPYFSYRLCNTVNSFLIGLVLVLLLVPALTPIFMVRDYDPETITIIY